MDGLSLGLTLMVLSDALGQPQFVQCSPHATLYCDWLIYFLTRLSVADIITDWIYNKVSSFDIDHIISVVAR